LQDLSYLSAAELTLGVRIGGWQLQRFVSVLRSVVIQVNELCTASLTNEHQALVLDNPQQPRREFGFSMESSDVYESLPTCILRFFFRFAAVAENESRYVYTSTPVPPNQLAKRISIACLRVCDEL